MIFVVQVVLQLDIHNSGEARGATELMSTAESLRGNPFKVCALEYKGRQGEELMNNQTIGKQK